MNLWPLESSAMYTHVMNLNADALHSHLQMQPDDLGRVDSAGFSALMHAVCLRADPALVLAIIDELIHCGADVNAADSDGFSVCHWAAVSGHAVVLQRLLLCPGIRPLARGPGGETPLHRACRFGKSDCAQILVSIVPGSTTQLNDEQLTPLQVAGVFGVNRNSEGRSRIRDSFASHGREFATLVLHHDDCLSHIPRIGGSQGNQPWESPERITAILTALKRTPHLKNDPLMRVSSEFPVASDAQILRCHSLEYLAFLYSLEAKVQLGPIPFTPAIQQSLGQMPIEAIKAGSLSDTSYSAGTLQAAKRACGSVCYAAQQVLDGSARNAFCVVRPPGHHVGFNGPLVDSCTGSCGFSILNSVMVAAMDIIETRRMKVAIVDLDIHHGNGSEHIVRRLGRPAELMFVSVHLHDNTFYPATGDKSDFSANIHNVPIDPLWQGGKGGRLAWLEAVNDRVVPLIAAFRPDIVLMSSGFDGACDDVGNCRHCIGQPSENGMDLTPADFASATDAICRVANGVCSGRVVSVLEGGYGRMQWSESTPSSSATYSEGGSTRASDNADNSPLRRGRKRVKTAPVFEQIINRQPFAQSATSHLKALLGLSQY